MVLPVDVPERRVVSPNLEMLQGNMCVSLAIESLLLL